MRNLFKLVLLLVASCATFGCAHNYYNIPQETVEKKVKVVGVVPFLTDPDSDIRHPEKSAIVTLIQGVNAKNEKEFIARLRGTGIFYSVRPVDGDASTLFSNVVASRERRDDAGIIYNKYFYKKDQLKQLMADNGLDAVLLVTVSGLTRQGKVYSSNFLSYLDTDFNYLTLTAQMLDRDGNAIWEYPNFRRSALSYSMLFPLQYPDFDEAAANLSDKVDVKFKTVAGIKAAFGKGEASAVANGPQVSTLYAKQYEEMLSLLQPYKPLFGGSKESSASAPATPPPVSALPDTAPEAAAPTATAAPAAAAPAKGPGPATPAKAPEAALPAKPAATPVAAGSAAPDSFSSSDIVPETRPANQ
jgi:hypothetical protein